MSDVAWIPAVRDEGGFCIVGICDNGEIIHPVPDSIFKSEADAVRVLKAYGVYNGATVWYSRPKGKWQPK